MDNNAQENFTTKDEGENIENHEEEKAIVEENNENNESDIEKYGTFDKYIFFTMFLFMGCLNNLGYTLIISGSQFLAGEFECEKFVGAYTL